MTMTFIRRIALIYFIYAIWLGVVDLNKSIEYTQKTWASAIGQEQDWVLSLFFKKWDNISKEYDFPWSKDNTERWYEIVTKPDFIKQPRIVQEAQAKVYIEAHLKDSKYVDYEKVEHWLVGALHDIGERSPEKIFCSLKEDPMDIVVYYLNMN